MVNIDAQVFAPRHRGVPSLWGPDRPLVEQPAPFIVADTKHSRNRVEAKQLWAFELRLQRP